MSAVQATSREDQLLDSVRGVLETKNYADSPLLSKSVNTHSLKELLIGNSVAMETTTETSITALCTVDSKPEETVECFESLLSFLEEAGGTVRRDEVAQVVFPLFAHVYLTLLTSGHSDTAQSFHSRFLSAVGPAHQGEAKELAETTSAEDLASSQLASKFRSQKYCLRMSSPAFQLLMQFLQVCSTPVLLNILQQHLAIEVYGSTPLVNGDPNKLEQKKVTQTSNFTKPTIPQLHTQLGAQAKKKRASLPKFQLSTMVTSGHTPTGAAMSTSDSALESTIGLIQRQLQRQASTSGPPTHLTEFREKLAQASLFDPSPPSVSLYTIDSGPVGAHCAALSASCKLFCCGLADSSIHVWSQLPGTTAVGDHLTTASNPPIRSQTASSYHSSTDDHRVLLGHYSPVYSTYFSNSGQYLLSSSEDCTVRLWDNHNKRRALACYRGHAYPVWDVAFSPVDVYFASASYDRTARLWTTDAAYPLRILAGHAASVDVVRFHPNGKYIATGSCDHTCRLWDIQSGRCVRLMTGSKGAVNCIAFSPNGKQLASGGEDDLLRVWDLGSGTILRELHTHSGGVASLAYSPDGVMLASSCHDNQIKVWNMNAIGASVSADATSESSQESGLISTNPTLATPILSLQFTHRNSLVAIGTSVPMATAFTHAQSQS